MAARIAARPQDLFYDPLYEVSGPRDEFKAALLAHLSSAKFAICPVFANMFSDLPNYPRFQYLRRRSAPLPALRYYRSSSAKTRGRDIALHRPPDVVGVDRFKYFHFPTVNVGADYIPPGLRLWKGQPDVKERRDNKIVEAKIRNQKIQTVYRESYAQTIPWQPSYKITDGSDPEILKLDFLKWGSGLPAGMHEVTLIERARMKRAWEDKFREVKTEDELKQRRSVIAAMERDEWAFREQEIQDIQNLRLALLEQMLTELHENSNKRNKAKLRQFAEMKKAEKEDKLRKLREKTKREIRKLDMKEKGFTMSYKPVNIVEEHKSHASELYAPLMRHGEHPKRWHQIIDESLKKFKSQFVGVENFNTLPLWLDRATRIKDCLCLPMPGRRLCMRETKWTTPVLKQLHQELLALRYHTKHECTLLQRIESPPSECSTPEVEGIPEQDEEFYQCMVACQSLIKGRAAQMHIYEGRERCRELIQELKYSTGLLEEENHRIHQYKQKIKLEQRNEQIETDKLFKLQESLDRLQGNVVGSLLDFLNKELRRLLEERRAHAICILLERERYDREAAEAGRRQVELRRRREHDEIFKQIVKIQQETVDLYLEDIIKEGMEFASEKEARDYVCHLAKKIDQEAYKKAEITKVDVDEEEESVAELVHHFVLPEVRKELARKKLLAVQKQKLRTVHDAIYTEIEDVRVPLANVPEDKEDPGKHTEFAPMSGEDKISQSREQSVQEDIVDSEFDKDSFIRKSVVDPILEKVEELTTERED